FLRDWARRRFAHSAIRWIWSKRSSRLINDGNDRAQAPSANSLYRPSEVEAARLSGTRSDAGRRPIKNAESLFWVSGEGTCRQNSRPTAMQCAAMRKIARGRCVFRPLCSAAFAAIQHAVYLPHFSLHCSVLILAVLRRDIITALTALFGIVVH